MYTKDQLIRHMENGGQIFRLAYNKKDRLFYKIENGKFMCRCNELGGWNYAYTEPKLGFDEFKIAEIDWDYNCFIEPEIIEIKLPTIEETLKIKDKEFE